MIKYNENEFYTKNVLRDNGSIWADKKQPREEFEPFAIEGKEMAITTNSKIPYVRMLEGKRNTFGWVIDVGSRYANNASYRDINYPIIAKGLVAMFLKAARCNNRGKWYIQDIESIYSQYRAMKEDGLPFDAQELQSYYAEIDTDFKSHVDDLQKYLPAELYHVVYKAISEYAASNENIVKASENMRSLLQEEDETERVRIIRNLVNGCKGAGFVDVGRQVVGITLARGHNKKDFIDAMYDSGLFDTHGKTKDSYYDSIKKGFNG